VIQVFGGMLYYSPNKNRPAAAQKRWQAAMGKA